MIKAEIIKPYIEKYSETLSKRAIATLIAEENKGLGTVEDIRSRVRYYMGQKGRDSRGHIQFFSGYPEPIEDDLFYIHQREKSKILLMGDIHVPFHDKRSLDLAVNHGLKYGADTVLLNGDIFDFS